MHFRTEIEHIEALFRLDHSQHMLAMGSCFADRMGERLKEAKFNVSVNPLGILYNPYSLMKVLDMAMQGGEIGSSHVRERAGVWHSFDLHSSQSASEESAFYEMLSTKMQALQAYLKSTDILILTFGTAMVHMLKETGEIVANCHKYPQDMFDKRMLEVEEMQNVSMATIKRWRAIRPEGKVILTVSPIRHTKEGLTMNQVSKSALRYVCHKLTLELEGVCYFPSYEIMMDDLRDYRFYKDDLIHPTSFAEDYIWALFTQCFMATDTLNMLDKWEKVKKSILHRPFNPKDKGYSKFLEELLRNLAVLNKKIDCSDEITMIQSRLDNLLAQSKT